MAELPSSALARDRWWIVANLLGAALYLWLASATSLEPELRGEGVARSGDAMVWGSTALPLLALFIVADVAWFVRRSSRQQTRQPVLLMALLWISVFCVGRFLS